MRRFAEYPNKPCPFLGLHPTGLKNSNKNGSY